MEERRTSSSSTLAPLPSPEDVDDPLYRHMTNVEIQNNLREVTSLRRQFSRDTGASDPEAAGESMNRGLTRADTTAYITKHPSRIPDEAMRRKEATYIVDFEGADDPLNPLNWPTGKKIRTTLLLGFTTFVVTFASSIFSSAIPAVSVEFDISTEVATLGTALFVLGFAFGPLIWAPLSELYGRKWPLLMAYGTFALFQIPVAVATNVQSIFIFRFLGGVFASSPLGIVGGALADIWTAAHRAAAIAAFAVATFVGPAMGPIIGGFVTQSYLGWRWTEHLTYILAFAFLTLDVLFLPETYAPVILKHKATKLRHEKNIWAIHARQEEKEVDFETIITVYLSRPMRMLLFEPMILLLTIYMSFVYGVVYLLFSAFPYSYQRERGWNEGLGALPFLGVSLGALIGGGIVVAFTPRYMRKMEKAGGPVPEERLLPMMIGGVLYTISLFWWSWTSFPTISAAPQIIAGVFLGAGVLLIFVPSFNYLIDSYLMFANSAIAGNTFMRSCFGAGFPMFATYMFDRLGLQWGGSLLGFIALALTPIPFLFYKYGLTLRRMSKFAPTKDKPMS